MTKRATGRSLADFRIEGMNTPNSLYPAEESLLKTAGTGLPCQVSKALPTEIIETNRVRGKFLRFLLLGGDENAPVHEKGIDLDGAVIEGDVNLENADVNRALSLWSCRIQGRIIARGAKLTLLNLQGSHVKAIDCDGTVIAGNVFLSNGFVSEGEVHFIGSEIRGTLDCNLGTFENSEGYALVGDSARIGSVALGPDFVANGGVRFPNATIEGNFDCTGGAFSSSGIAADGSKIIAIDCGNIKIACNVFFRGNASVQGEVRFAGAMINGQFTCGSAAFSNPEGAALVCDAIKVIGDVFLSNHLECKGEVRFPGAVIGGDLDCSNSSFQNECGLALLFNRAKIDGKVWLCNGFGAQGSIRFIGATIGAELDLRKAKVTNQKVKASEEGKPGAFEADGAQILGAVFLGKGFEATGIVQFPRAKVGGKFDCRGGHFNKGDDDKKTKSLACNGAIFSSDVFLADDFQAFGEVNFNGAKIGGRLACTNGEFRNPDGYALRCDGTDIAGDVSLDNNFRAEGEVRFSQAHIGGFLWCAGGIFDSANNNVALNLQSSRIEDRLWLAPYEQQPAARIQGSLKLAGTKVNSLVDSQDSWPKEIWLDGFIYGRFADNAPTDANIRKKWLLRQSALHLTKSFRPQPFEQLIKTLREMGHGDDAKAIAVFKQQKLTERITWRGLPYWFWRLFLKYSVGYGYRPFRTVFGAIIFCLFCGWVYQQAASQGLIAPTNPRVYLEKSLVEVCDNNWTDSQCPLNIKKGHSIFNPWIFSIDTMLPIINLRQAEQWQPVRGAFDFPVLGKLCPEFIRGLMWFEIFFGWAASLIMTAVVSGIIKKE